jgi:hypothetical protein
MNAGDGIGGGAVFYFAIKIMKIGYIEKSFHESALNHVRGQLLMDFYKCFKSGFEITD